MGGFVSKCEKFVKNFDSILTAFRGVVAFFQIAKRVICDTIFSQRQFEYSSEQDQSQTRVLIEEQRRKKAGYRRKMTCKCCNERLVDYTFDCGDMACQQCNDTRCAQQCFDCNEVILKREFMGYDRSALV